MYPLIRINLVRLFLTQLYHLLISLVQQRGGLHFGKHWGYKQATNSVDACYWPPCDFSTSPLPQNSDCANVDDTLVVQPGSLCESPADVEKHYPTWTTHRSPRHLKEYQL